MNHLPFSVRFPLGTLGALCAILFIPFWIGMIWDCLFQSKLPLLSKALWLAFIMPTVYLGMLVYFFVVYEKRGPRISSGNSLLHH